MLTQERIDQKRKQAIKVFVVCWILAGLAGTLLLAIMVSNPEDTNHFAPNGAPDPIAIGLGAVMVLSFLCIAVPILYGLWLQSQESKLRFANRRRLE